jgi:hypothetical protein
MEQSFWKADSFSASQDIPSLYESRKCIAIITGLCLELN